MPRHRRVIGPRRKIDIASLRDLPREERLRLLTQSFTECGGRSEAEWGGSFKRALSDAKSVEDRRSGVERAPEAS